MMQGGKPDIDERGMYTATEAARRLRIDYSTFYRWKKAGRIRPIPPKRIKGKSFGTPRYSGKHLLDVYYYR